MSTYTNRTVIARALRLFLPALLLLLGASMLAGPAAHAQSGGLVFTIEAPGVQESQVTCLSGLAVENFDSLAPGGYTTYTSGLGAYARAGTYDFLIQSADSVGGAGGVGNYIATEVGEAYVLNPAQPAGYFGFWWSAGNGNNEITVNLQGGASQTFSTQAILDAPGLVGTPGTAGGHFGNPTSAFNGQNPDEVYAFVNIFATDSNAKITSIVFSEKPGGVGRFESDNHAACPDILDPNTGSPVPQTGTIVIRKVTQPSGALDQFTFTHNIGTSTSFTLGDGDTETFADVVFGEFTVTEDDPGPAGYSLTALSCADSVATGQASSADLASRTATIRLEVGETVTCTFTNRNNSLAVTLAGFDAQAQAGHMLVTWETVSELDNAGFNLYRTGTADPPTSADLLAYVPSQGPGSTQGFAYSHQDYAVTAGQTTWYWLEDVDLNGATTLHGPVSVVFVAPTAVTLDSLNASPAAPAGSLSLLALPAVVSLALGAAWALRRTKM
jgi:hypothetical protein